MIRRRIVATSLVASAVALLGLAACGSSQKPALEEPVGETHTTAATAPAPATAAPARHEEIGVSVTPRTRMACNMPDTVAEAPRFDFDSSELRPRGDDILHRLGVCLTTGPLAGKKVCITGYADPRGSEGYNYDLGLARGYAAMHYLQKFAVAPSQTEVVSEGESEAKGTGPGTYALDRRVEIDVADGACTGEKRP